MWESNWTSARRRGEVDGDGGYPGDRGEETFDEPRAAGAAHAFYGEGDGAGTAATVGCVGLVVVVGASSQQGCLHFGHAPRVQFGSVAGIGGSRALGVAVGA